MGPQTESIESLVLDAVRARVCPGAVWAVGDASGTSAGGAAGLLDPARPDEPMRADTLFDLASLTKIVAVWSVTGTLVESGVLELHRPLGSFWPEVAGRPLGAATAHHLLTHTAGLPLRANLRFHYGSDPDEVRAGVLGEPLRHRPGEAVAYTDRAALVLGYLAEHLTGRRLAHLAAARVWNPLGMTETRYGPLAADVASRCAPTEFDDATGTHLKGTVHDFSTRLLGGACGIAGVFAPRDDLCRFLHHTLSPGRSAFGASWVQRSLRVRTGELRPARGLFWHPDPGTTAARHDVWAHFGFTGTAMWVSPARGRWAVLLTNKLYFTRDGVPVARLRAAFRSLAFA
ncbi:MULTISPECIES: serine hydrolase domain-containing protein [Streptomyces]|uniref:serine hydrolase domain-containing protein n=1 Tax=Streptomyces TaxID=1883 RepID=UPI0013184804|nr:MULTISPECIES: serine hydrolase domain-containing protein [Streptomyces]QGZ52331.1 serine hydrolase [Streptomyces sp. QHH-9511]GGT86043.1 esterase [Streptomyces lateritius]